MKLALSSSVNSGMMAADPPSSATRLRPLLAAGVALAGAGLIAANPVAPNIAGLEQHAVELTGFASEISRMFNPFEPGVYGWFDVVSQSFNQLGITASDWLADPFPIASQLLTNAIGYADTTFTSLEYAAGGLGVFLFGDTPYSLVPSLMAFFDAVSQGEFYPQAATALNSILFNGLEFMGEGLAKGGIFDIPIEMSRHLDAVIGTLFGDGPAGLASIIGGVIGSGEAGFWQAGAALDAASTAFGNGDWLTGLLDTARIVPSFYYGLLDGIVDNANSIYQAGLLTAIGGFPGGTEPVAGGLLASLLVYLPQQIAIDLGPGLLAEHALSVGSLAADLLGAL